MRQRIPQAAKAATHGGSRETSLDRSSSMERSTGGSGSWEITSDDAGEASAIPNPVPMFNPLHHYASYKKEYDIPAAPGSLPLLWQRSSGSAQAGAHNSNVMIPAAPNSLTGLRTSQLPSLAPAFIPDNKYHAYLMGRPWKKKAKPMLTKICFAKFCICFSWVGAIFLGFIGILLDRQPLYIPKVLPKHTQFSTGDRKPRHFYTVLLSERLLPASNAYAAAACYVLTGVLSYMYLNNFWGYFNRRRRRSLYQDIPDADSTIANFGGSRLDPNGDLPTYDTVGNSPVMRAYQYNNRLSRRLWESLSLTMHRVGMYLATVWPRYQDQRRARRRYTGAKDI